MKKIVIICIVSFLIALAGCTSLHNNSSDVLNQPPSYLPVSTNLVPQHIQNIVLPYAKKNGIDPYIIYGIMKIESSFDPYAENDGCYGLMQLSLPAAQSIRSSVTPRELYNSKVNAHIGIKYYQAMLSLFNNNNFLAIAAFNAGSQNVTEWIQENPNLTVDQIPFYTTRNYLQTLINFYNQCKLNQVQ